MLIRNLEPPKLCNKTKLTITVLNRNRIDAENVIRQFAGERVFIPRMPVKSSSLFVEFCRVQFPVKLCFAFTIKKSQGQTLKVAGINLSEPCFVHGQLYVACFRVELDQLKTFSFTHQLLV